MKKSLFLIVSVVMIGLLTGCQKEKVLDCDMKQEQNGMEMKQNLKATFKGNEVKDITVKMDVILEEKYKSYADMFVSSIDSQFDKYKDKKGITYKTEKNDDGVVVTFYADLDKMDKDTKEELDMVDTTGSYEKTKEDLEKDGYTCK